MWPNILLIANLHTVPSGQVAVPDPLAVQVDGGSGDLSSHLYQVLGDQRIVFSTPWPAGAQKPTNRPLGMSGQLQATRIFDA